MNLDERINRLETFHKEGRLIRFEWVAEDDDDDGRERRAARLIAARVPSLRVLPRSRGRDECEGLSRDHRWSIARQGSAARGGYMNVEARRPRIREDSTREAIAAETSREAADFVLRG